MGGSSLGGASPMHSFAYRSLSYRAPLRCSNACNGQFNSSRQKSCHALMALISLITRSSPMASITIRNLEDGLKSKLRVRAARHGRSMEDEARHILRSGLAEKTHE